MALHQTARTGTAKVLSVQRIKWAVPSLKVLWGEAWTLLHCNQQKHQV